VTFTEASEHWAVLHPDHMAEDEYHALTGRRFGDHTGWYHGTNAPLSPGQLLTPSGADRSGRHEGYSRRAHVYFSGSMAEAGDYADSRAERSGGTSRVYAVHPLDDFSEDREGNQDDGWKTKGRLIVSHEIQPG
jgi:hypothetical protein